MLSPALAGGFIHWQADGKALYFVQNSGLLLPAASQRWGAKAAVLLTALAWAVYHLAQFHFFPARLAPALQFELFGFGLGYALFYLWSGSLLYTSTTRSRSPPLRTPPPANSERRT